MRFKDETKSYSPTDLSTHSECEHRTVLEMGVALGKLRRPGESEIRTKLLEMRGREHERRVLEHYKVARKRVAEVRVPPGEDGRQEALEKTEGLMREGADVIYQGALRHEAWFGKPDFLVRAPGRSRFGEFHYEAVDAKLARETKARAVLQLCVYTELLAKVQERPPERFWIAPGTVPVELQELRAADFMAYYRRVRREFEAFIGNDGRRAPYPEPVEHCAICPWWSQCEERRRTDDHLSLVAGVTRRQRERLTDATIGTVAALGSLAPSTAVAGIRDEVLGRIREQARIQVEGRCEGRPKCELLPQSEERAGLELLPEPAELDLFLDLEGDSFVGGEGIEYLFGLLEVENSVDPFDTSKVTTRQQYFSYWATTRAEEKRAFEAVVDHIVRRRREFPRLHLYHFGHRENDALKKLASRHDTRASEVDEFLRAGVLVDLHRVVRQGIRASVESYSLKQLEPLYDFSRRVPVRDASVAMQLFGWWLETGESKQAEPELRDLIAKYNEDDCFSTWKLRDFLEEKRKELDWPQVRRPEDKEGKASEEKAKRNAETEALVQRLREGLPDESPDEPPSVHARRLLSHLLGWHQRELKPGWWEYYRTLELPAEERFDDRLALGNLRWVHTDTNVKPGKRSYTHRYEFEPQEHGIRVGNGAIDPVTKKGAGTVVDVGANYLLLSRVKNSPVPHPTALVPDVPVQTDEQEASLRRLATWMLENDTATPGPYQAGLDLLMRRPPRIGSTAARLVDDGEDTTDAICRLARALDHSTLAVQGSPGSGKTTAAARMIVELARAGKRVGVIANSHKVIVHLLRKAIDAASKTGAPLRVLHMGDEEDVDGDPGDIQIRTDYAKIAPALRAGEFDLVGGTAWALSREIFAGSLHALAVDEAGQMSLANVLAVSPAAQNLILFGDPAQLDQPQKGSHPPGSGHSALQHIIGDEEGATMPPDRGVFMPHTRRLHPDICKFTSTVFYEGRLQADPELGRQRIVASGPLSGSGLRFIGVEHRGNTNHSPEEIDHIALLLEELFRGQPKFVNKHGIEAPLEKNDVLIV